MYSTSPSSRGRRWSSKPVTRSESGVGEGGGERLELARGRLVDEVLEARGRFALLELDAALRLDGMVSEVSGGWLSESVVGRWVVDSSRILAPVSSHPAPWVLLTSASLCSVLNGANPQRRLGFMECIGDLRGYKGCCKIVRGTPADAVSVSRVDVINGSSQPQVEPNANELAVRQTHRSCQPLLLALLLTCCPRCLSSRCPRLTPPSRTCTPLPGRNVKHLPTADRGNHAIITTARVLGEHNT
jgi:hypothetical protein